MPAPARRPGSALLVLAGVAVLGLIAIVVLPEQIRALVGAPPTPTAPGPEPSVPEATTTTGTARDPLGELALAPVRVRTPGTASAPVVVTTVAKATKQEDPRALALLASAETAYRAYKWSEARNLALQLAELPASPVTILRARDIALRAPLLGELFRVLNERDELQRGWDTNPSLVEIQTGQERMLAVPIRSIDDKEPTAVDGDPVAAIARDKASGQVAVVMKGVNKYLPTVIQADRIGTVSRVDVTAVIKARREAFLPRLQRLASGSAANNALAWYEAGKIAFQDRLDDQVVACLDRAVLLDKGLARTVREDRAGTLFAAMTAHLKDGNRRQAEAYLALITRRYGDTDQGRQARLFFDGKTEELLAMAKAAATKQEADERARAAELAKRAAETGDQVAAAAAKAVGQEEDEPEEAAAPVTGDLGKAKQLADQAAKLAAKAVDMPATDARDQVYAQCSTFAIQASGLFARLLAKEKDPAARQDIESQMLAVNRIKYLASKYRRFH